MNKKEILNISNSIKQQLNSGRLFDAFQALRQLSEQALAYEITDKVKQCEQTYTYMLSYLAKGSDDPSRAEVYSGIVIRLRQLLDLVVRRMLTSETPTLYYNVLRTLNLRGEDSVAREIQSYLALDDLPVTDVLQQRERERLQRRLFDSIWVQFPLTVPDAAGVRQLLLSDVADELKQMVVGAITMGLLEFYDLHRFELLADAYQNGSAAVRARAITGLLISIFRYRNRKAEPALANLINLLRELPDWSRDLSTTFGELARTRDTERITRQLKEEVLPDIIKRSRNLNERFRDAGLTPEDADNPEWEEVLRESGISDKIRYFSELQESGSDVYMATFSQLKQFPFFNEIANWFMPFTVNRSEFAEMNDVSVLTDMVTKVPFMCDSDKYSMLLSIGMMPQAQRDLMLAQMKQQARQMEEQLKHAGTDDGSNNFRQLVNAYVLDLYRFFKLFRRKGEFFNPFDGTFNLMRVKLLAQDFSDPTLLRAMAEVYFKIRAWDDALYIFDKLMDLEGFRTDICQKCGYCYERMGKFDDALVYYTMACDMGKGNDIWSLSRKAAMQRKVGDNSGAANTFALLEELQPDDAQVAHQAGYAYMANGEYDKAINRFFKVEFLAPDSTRHLRPLAWTQMLAGKLDESHKTYERILVDNADEYDYTNMGHLALVEGHVGEAINYYLLAVNCLKGDVDKVLGFIDEDRKELQQLNVDLDVLPLVFDSIRYNSKL